MRSNRAIDGLSNPAAAQSSSTTSSAPERATDVIRQIRTSAPMSNSTSEGRGLLVVPDVNGNLQIKTSPNFIERCRKPHRSDHQGGQTARTQHGAIRRHPLHRVKSVLL